MYKNNCEGYKKFRTFGLKYKAIVKVCTFILISFSLPILIVGCNTNKQSLTTSKNTTVDNIKKPYPIDASNIKSITRLNIFPGDATYAVLEPGKNKEKIDKIIKLINSGSNVRVSTEEDLNVFLGKGPYPTTLKIVNKDNSYFTIKLGYIHRDIKENGKIIGGEKAPLKDRFILQFFKDEKTNKPESYTIFSNEVGNYLLNSKDLEDDFQL